jgi:hypothetical protein
VYDFDTSSPSFGEARFGARAIADAMFKDGVK